MTSLLVSLLLVADAGAAPDALADPRAIDRACNAAEKYVNKHESEGHIVADVSDAVLPKSGEGVWRNFKNPKDLKDAGTDGSAPNTQATVWIAPGGITYVAAFFQSDSGDWAHFVESCYRADGTLARTESTYNTFLADEEDGVSRVRMRHYDASGKNVLRSKQKVLNLQTRKPFPKARFSDEQEPLYPQRTLLPFWDAVREVLPPPVGGGPAP